MSKKEELYNYLNPSSTEDKEIDEFVKRAVKSPSSDSPLPTAISGESRVYELPESPKNFEGYVDLTKTDLGNWNNVTEQRAKNQSSWEVLEHGLHRFGATTLTKFGQGVGFLGGFLNWAAGGFGLDNISKMTDNGFSNMFESLEEWDKNTIAPVYATKDNIEGNILQKMGTLSWWMNDAVDGFAFMASSMLPGGIIKGIGIGSKGLKGLQIGNKIVSGVDDTKALGKYFTNLMTKAKAGDVTLEGTKAFKLAQNIDRGLITTWNTIAESAMEARDVKRQTYNGLLKQMGKSEEELTPEEKQSINIKASQAALGTFGANLFIVGASEWLMSSIWNKVNPSEKAIVTASKADIPNLGWKDYVSKIGKSWGTNALREGVYEENAQLAVSDFFRDKELGVEKRNFFEGALSNMVKNFTTDEGQQNIVLGAITGILPGTFSTIKQVKAENKFLKNTRANLVNSFNILNKGVSYAYETDDNGQLIPAKEGELNHNGIKLNINKLQDIAQATLNTTFDIAKLQNLPNKDVGAILTNLIDSKSFFPYIKEDGGLDVFKAHAKLVMENKLDELDKEGKLTPEIRKEQEELYQSRIKNAAKFDTLLNHLKQGSAYTTNLGYEGNKDVQTFREITLSEQYNALTDILAYRESSNKVGEDKYNNYDGSKVKEQKNIDNALQLIKEDKLLEVDDKILNKLGINKEVLQNLPSDAIDAIKKTIELSLVQASEAYKTSIEKDSIALKQALEKYNKWTNQDYIKEQFEEYKKTKKQNKVEQKKIEKEVAEVGKNFKTNTTFDILGDKLHNHQNNNNTIFGKWIDSLIDLDDESKARLKKNYGRTDDFIDVLKRAEDRINNNIDKFYKENSDEIDNDKIKEYIKNDVILNKLEESDAELVVSNVLNNEKDSDYDKVEIAKRVDELNNTFTDKEIKNNINLTESLIPLREKAATGQELTEDDKKLTSTLTNGIGNLILDNKHDIVAVNITTGEKYEFPKNITTDELSAELLKHPLRNHDYYDETKQIVSVNDIEADLKQYIEQLPQQVNNLLNTLKIQLSELKQRQKSGKINKLIANNIKRIDETIDNINNELKKLVKENINITKSATYSVLERGNRAGAEVQNKLSYLPLINGKWQSKIPGHSYTGQELDKYAKAIKEGTILSIRHDNNKEYENESPVEQIINDMFFKGMTVNQIVLKLREILDDSNGDILIKEQIPGLLEFLGYNDVTVDTLESAVYDMINLSVADTNKETNPLNIEFWVHKPRILLKEINQLSSAINENDNTELIESLIRSTNESLQELREKRRYIIDNIKNNPTIALLKKEGGQIVIGDTISLNEFSQNSPNYKLYIKTGSLKFVGENGKELKSEYAKKFDDYTQEGNIVAVVKEGNQERVVFLTPNLFTDKNIPFIIDLLTKKLDKNNKPETIVEFKNAIIGNTPQVIKGELGQIFDSIIKWNRTIQLEKNGKLNNEGKSKYRFEPGVKDDKYGIYYGEDGFIEYEHFATTANIDNLNKFVDWLKQNKRYNISKELLGKTNDKVEVNGKILDYNSFIKNMLSTNVDNSGGTIFHFPTLVVDLSNISYDNIPVQEKKFEEVINKDLTLDELMSKFKNPNKKLQGELNKILSSLKKKYVFRVEKLNNYKEIADKGLLNQYYMNVNHKTGVITVYEHVLENNSESVIEAALAHEVLHPHIIENLTLEQRARLYKVLNKFISEQDKTNAQLAKSEGKDAIESNKKLLAQRIKDSGIKLSDKEIESVATTLHILATKNDKDIVDELITYLSTNKIFGKYLQQIQGTGTIKQSVYSEIMQIIHEILDVLKVPHSLFTEIYDILGSSEIKNEEKIRIQPVVEKVDTKVETELEKINREEQEEINNLNNFYKNKFVKKDKLIPKFILGHYIYNFMPTLDNKEGIQYDGIVIEVFNNGESARIELKNGLKVLRKQKYTRIAKNPYFYSYPDFIEKPLKEEIQQKYQQKRDKLSKKEDIPVQEEVKQPTRKTDKRQRIEQLVDGTLIQGKTELFKEDYQVAADGIFNLIVTEKHLGLKGDIIEVNFYEDVPEILDEKGNILQEASDSVLTELKAYKEDYIESNPIWANNIQLLIDNIDKLEETFNRNLVRYKLKLALDIVEKDDESTNDNDETDVEVQNETGIQEHIKKPYQNDYKNTANANIRFMIDRMVDVEDKLDSQGKVVFKRDNTFGMKLRADSEKSWKTLMEWLHDAKNSDDIFGEYDDFGKLVKEGKLSKLAAKFPIYKQLLDKFSIEWDNGKIVNTTSPKERYIQVFNVFNKWKNEFYKTTINVTENGVFYKNMNQTKLETQLAIIEQWSNNFVNSDLFDYKNNKYNIVKFADIKVNQFDELYKDIIGEQDYKKRYKDTQADSGILNNKYRIGSTNYNNVIEKLVKITNQLGIGIDIATANEIIKTKAPNDSGRIQLRQLVSELGLTYILDNITKYINESTINKEGLEYKNHITDFNKGDMYKIMKYYIAQHPEVIETQIPSIEDSDYQLYMLHHHMTKLVQDIKNGDYSYIKLLKSLPQFTNSRWINEIYKNTVENFDQSFVDNLNVITWNFLKNENTKDIGKQYSDLSKIEQEIQIMVDLMNVSKEGEKLKTVGQPIFTPMTFSSRTSWYKLTGFNALQLNLTIDINGNITIPNTLKDLFLGYLDDEMLRILEVKKQVLGIDDKPDLDERQWIENYHYYTTKNINKAIDRWKSNGLEISEENLVYNEKGDKIVGFKKGNQIFPIGLGGEFVVFKSLNAHIGTAIKGSESTIKHVEDVIKREINKELENAVKLGIIRQTADEKFSNNLIDNNLLAYHKQFYQSGNDLLDTSRAIQNIIANLAVNHIVSGIEFEKLLGIEPSVWKSREDETKRLSVYSSTKEVQDDGTLIKHLYGNKLVSRIDSEGKRVYNVAILKDLERPSSVYENIFNVYKEQYIKQNDVKGKTEQEIDNEVSALISGFGNINVTDGQTWANPYKDRDLAIRTGRWSDEHEEVFNFLQMEGKYDVPLSDIPIQELERLSEIAHRIQFNPRKTLYLGNKIVKGENSKLLVPIIMKHSEVQVYKRFAQDKEIQEIYERLTGTGKYKGQTPIDMIGSTSTFKGAILDNMNFYEEGEQFKQRIFKDGKEKIVDVNTKLSDLSKLYVFELDAQNMGVQLEVPVHKATQTKIGTQVKKVLMSNIDYNTEYDLLDDNGNKLKGKELVQHLNNVLSLLSNKGLEEVKGELGWNDETQSVNQDKLTKKIIDNLRRNQVGEDFISAIEKGVFLDMFGGLKNKVFQSVNKYLQNKTVDLKLDGQAAVQVSGFGVFKGRKQLATLGFNTYKEYSDTVGKLQILFNEDGSLKGWQTIVNIGMFRKVIPNYESNTFEKNREWLLKNKEVLEIFGHRIPNQATSSNLFMEVVDVIPEGNGDVIILPDELTTATGSDFDIDKLFIFKYNYKVENGKLKKLDYINNPIERFERYNKELVRNGKEEITEEHFNKLLLEQQQTEESLQNRLLDIFKAILQNKEHTLETLTPLDGSLLKDHSNMIGVLTGKIKKLDDLEFYSLRNTLETKQRLLGGKGNVGSGALNRVDIPLAQMLGYDIRGVEGMEYILGNIVDLKNNIVLISIGDKTREIIVYDYKSKKDIIVNYYDLSLRDKQFKDKDNILVTDRFNWLITSFVDLEKDPYITYINMSKYVVNVASLLYRLGMGSYTEVYTAQPFIRMLDEWKNNYDNELVKKPTYSQYEYSIEQGQYVDKNVKLGREFDFYKITEKYFRDILSAKSIEDIVKNRTKNSGVKNVSEDTNVKDFRWSPAHYENGSLAKIYHPTNNTVYDKDSMYEFMRIQRWLDNPTKDNIIEVDKFKDGTKFPQIEVTLDVLQDYAKKQLDMLEHYKLLEKAANKLRQITLAGRADTGSIGKNIYTIDAAIEKINDLKYDRNIEQFKNKMEGYSVENIGKQTTFIGTNYNNHPLFIKKLLKDRMLWYNENFRINFIDQLTQLLPTNVLSDDKILKKIGNELFSSIAIDYMLNKYIKELGIDESKKNKYVRSLFFGSNSLAKRLSRLKDKINKGEIEVGQETKNFIVNHIREKYGEKKDEPDFIKATARLDETQKTRYREVWKEMLNSNNSELNKFAHNLLAYTFLTTGTSNSRFGISDLLPYDYLIVNGYQQHFAEFTSNLPFEKVQDMLFDIILNNYGDKNIIPVVYERNIMKGDFKSKISVRDDNGVVQDKVVSTVKFETEKWKVSRKNFKQYYIAKTEDGIVSILRGSISEDKDSYLPFIARQVEIFDSNTGNSKMETFVYALSNQPKESYENTPTYIKINKKGYYSKGFAIKEYGGIELKEGSNDAIDLLKSDGIKSHIIENSFGELSTVIDEGREVKDEQVQEQSVESKPIIEVIYNKISEITNHSGGALGADSEWDNIGKEFGMINNKHYYYGNKTPKGNVLLTQEQVNEGIIEMHKAAKILDKNPQKQETINLLARNWFQVKNSTQIVAIAPINESMKWVEGGTGWAVAMAQGTSKEINVFDLKTSKWFKWDKSTNIFAPSSTPILHKNFAGIGSRQITKQGKKAIKDVYTKTMQLLNRQHIEQLPTIEQKDNNLGKIVDFMKELSTEQRDMFRKLRELGKFDIECK